MIEANRIYTIAEGTFLEAQPGDEAVLYNVRTASRVKISSSLYAVIQLLGSGQSIESLIAGSKGERLTEALLKLCEKGLLFAGREEPRALGGRRRGVALASPTCFRTPLSQLGSRHTSVSFLGLPYDAGNTVAPGARGGPRAIREASCASEYRLDVQTGAPAGWYSIDQQERILAGVTMSDKGNLVWEANETALSYNECASLVIKDALRESDLPVFLGGDHSLSFNIVRELGLYSPLYVLWLDAHNDAAPLETDTQHHHGNVLSRIMQLNFVAGVVVVGTRGIRQFPGAPVSPKLQMISAREIRQQSRAGALEELIPYGAYCYVSLDVDAFDPSIAPATPTPVPNGLFLDHLLEVVSTLASRCRIVGLDVMELTPERDINCQTAFIVCTFLLNAIGYISRGEKLNSSASSTENEVCE